MAKFPWPRFTEQSPNGFKNILAPSRRSGKGSVPEKEMIQNPVIMATLTHLLLHAL